MDSGELMKQAIAVVNLQTLWDEIIDARWVDGVLSDIDVYEEVADAGFYDYTASHQKDFFISWLAAKACQYQSVGFLAGYELHGEIAYSQAMTVDKMYNIEQRVFDQLFAYFRFGESKSDPVFGVKLIGRDEVLAKVKSLFSDSLSSFKMFASSDKWELVFMFELLQSGKVFSELGINTLEDLKVVLAEMKLSGELS